MAVDAASGSRSQRMLVEAYNCRGAAWGDKGDLDKAIENFSQAIEINPKHFFAHCNRGKSWHCKEELDRAISDYTQAIEIRPNEAEIYLARGWIWKALDKPEKAAADFAKVKELKDEMRALKKASHED